MEKGFIYRRVAGIIPCVLPGIGISGLSLGSKYDVASARDVFLSAHYWRLFEFLETEPHLIVDLGSHCGHFSILCHLICKEKFGRDLSSYVLVEPVDLLLRLARRNLTDAGIMDRATLHKGLIGNKSGAARLNCNRTNLLASSIESDSLVSKTPQADGIGFLNLSEILPATKPIDVLKIDIEGSEREFLIEYPDVISRTKVLLIELHGDRHLQHVYHEQILALGMKSASIPIQRGLESMRIYVR